MLGLCGSMQPSLAVVCRLSLPTVCGKSVFPARDWTCVPCIGREILCFLFFFYFLCSGLRWVFMAAHRLAAVAESRVYSLAVVAGVHCSDFSCRGARALGAQASVAAVHELSSCSPRALEHRLRSCDARVSCSAACGIFGDQGSNSCLLTGRQILYHWATREVPFSLLQWIFQCSYFGILKPFGSFCIPIKIGSSFCSFDLETVTFKCTA